MCPTWSRLVAHADWCASDGAVPNLGLGHPLCLPMARSMTHSMTRSMTHSTCLLRIRPRCAEFGTAARAATTGNDGAPFGETAGDGFGDGFESASEDADSDYENSDVRHFPAHFPPF